MPPRAKKKLTSEEIAFKAARAAEDKKALDIKIIDIHKLGILADFLVIATAESPPQIRAVCENVREKLQKSGLTISDSWEGLLESNWRVLDLGNVVVHVLGEEERKFYKLEELWGKVGIIHHVT